MRRARPPRSVPAALLLVLLAVVLLAAAACDGRRASPPPRASAPPRAEATHTRPPAAERYPREVPSGGVFRAIGPIPEGRFVMIEGGNQTICGLADGGNLHCIGAERGLEPPPGPFLDVSVGSWSACGRRPQGALACWGYDLDGSVSDTPDGRFTAVATNTTSCALDEERIPRCWGPDGGAPPATPVRELAAGSSHVCVLRMDRRIACVAADPFLAGRTYLEIPDTEFEHVYAGYEHVCALDADRRAHCWGRDVGGETEVDEDARFVSLALGEKRSMGLRADGSVVSWGGDAPEPRVGPYAAIAITANEGYSDLAFACAIRRDTRALECWPYEG